MLSLLRPFVLAEIDQISVFLTDIGDDFDPFRPFLCTSALTRRRLRVGLE